MTSTAVTAVTAGTERAAATPVNDRTPVTRPAIVRRSLVLVGILLATLAVLLGGASAASAVTVTAQSGYPGTANLVATYGASTGFGSAKITGAAPSMAGSPTPLGVAAPSSSSTSNRRPAGAGHPGVPGQPRAARAQVARGWGSGA